MEIKKPWDKKKEAKGLIRHYVIGGHPGEPAIKDSGAHNQVEYYEGVIEAIRGWSGLTEEETLEAIQDSPNTIENTTDKPNFKPLYLQALENIRNRNRTS